MKFYPTLLTLLSTSTEAATTYFNGVKGEWQTTGACPAEGISFTPACGEGIICPHGECTKPRGKCSIKGNGCVDERWNRDACAGPPTNVCGSGYCGTGPDLSDCRCVDGECHAVTFVMATTTTSMPTTTEAAATTTTTSTPEVATTTTTTEIATQEATTTAVPADATSQASSTTPATASTGSTAANSQSTTTSSIEDVSSGDGNDDPANSEDGSTDGVDSDKTPVGALGGSSSASKGIFASIVIAVIVSFAV
jgi:hypothetical protein|eukprot:g11272.t1 g11272   contig5:503782-504622(-)